MKREKSCRVHSNNFFPSSSSAKPAAGGRGCATIGSKSPGESIASPPPHVDVRPSGANPPERALLRHLRTWMCDHREQIPRRERHPVTSARGCATTGSKSPGESVIPSHPHVDVRPPGANPPERASSRHIRTWMCYPREQTPSEGVTESPVSLTPSEGVEPLKA